MNNGLLIMGAVFVFGGMTIFGLLILVTEKLARRRRERVRKQRQSEQQGTLQASNVFWAWQFAGAQPDASAQAERASQPADPDEWAEHFQQLQDRQDRIERTLDQIGKRLDRIEREAKRPQ